jgi:hypothetical protein
MRQFEGGGELSLFFSLSLLSSSDSHERPVATLLLQWTMFCDTVIRTDEGGSKSKSHGIRIRLVNHCHQLLSVWLGSFNLRST